MWVFSAFLHRAARHIPSSGVQVHAGYYRVSIIHRTLTWTTGMLTCVHDLSYACVYTRGLNTPTASQHNPFDSEKLTVPLTGFEPSIFGSPVQRTNHWAHPSIPHISLNTQTSPYMYINLNEQALSLKEFACRLWTKIIISWRPFWTLFIPVHVHLEHRLIYNYLI